MKPRYTAWLLMLLLGITANFGVPMARVPAARASYSVVIVDKSQARHQEIAEPDKTVLCAADPAVRLLPGDCIAPASLLDPSLFQRPPPAIS